MGSFKIKDAGFTIRNGLFLVYLVCQPDFIAGKYDIGWVGRYLEERREEGAL